MAKGKKSAVATAKPIVRNVEVKSSEANSSVKSRGDAERDYKIEPAKGKLGVMIPGMGAVATTFVGAVGGMVYSVDRASVAEESEVFPARSNA